MSPGASDDGEPVSFAPAVAETHSAVVFFFGDRAFKVKKPVDLGFLDFTDLDSRRRVCQREVELNRRLAPDVYLGVAELRDVAGEVIEHLVTMRRMPPERRLSTLVEQGADVGDDLWRLAHLLAAFHSDAAGSPAVDEAARPGALAGRWSDNTDTLRELARPDSPVGALDLEMVEHVQVLADRYLDGRGPLFEQRIADGRARDGHGDLLADDIFLLEDGPRVLDCIEFDDRIRYGDTLADVAFLAMDLERLDRPDLAARFLAAYREHADDAWPESLAHHHVAYRAHVRSKVAGVRAGQGATASADEARHLLGIAHDHLEAGRVRLVVVGGLPGTGKSTLADGLADALGAAVLRSDEVRKELAGLAPDTSAAAPFGEGIYSEAHGERTYRTLLDRATVALEHGESVVLDASWTDAVWRAEARTVAESTHADLVELQCEAPAELAGRRLRERAAPGRPSDSSDASDATPEIAAAMAEKAAPWPTATSIDTSGTPEGALEQALGHILVCDLRSG